MPEGTQILEYYDPSASRDKWGRPVNYNYGLFDKNGNFIEKIDPSKLSPINNGEQLAFTGIQEKIYNPDNTIYHGRVQRNYDDGKGNYIKTYWKPGEDMIVEMSDFNKWNQLDNGEKAFRLPKELVDVINKNPDFWNNLLESSVRERFIATLRDAVSSQASELIPFVTTGYGTGNNWLFGKKEQSLGFSDEDLEAFMNLMKSLGGRNGKSTYKRERDYLMPLYQPVERMQKGGLIGTTVADDKSVKTVKVEDSKDINKAAGTNNKGVSFDSSTSADKMQLASIVMDLSSLGLTAVPVYGNIAGAIAGVGGTAAQFSADVKRDGLDWGDAGHALMGLGFDVATLLPGLGSAAKLGKLSKNIAKIAPIIKGVLLAAGAVNGVKGLNNILSGDYSIDDFRSVANGIMAGVGIGRKVGEINASKMKKPADVETVKSKTTDDFKREYIDGFVKRNPGATRYNDSDVEWYNPQTKQITDYDKAAEGLRGYKNAETKEEFKIKEGIQKLKANWDRVSTAAKNMKTEFWSSVNNPLSQNFRWRSTNRTLGETPEEIAAAFRANPNAVARLANLNEDVASQLRDSGYRVKTNVGIKAKVRETNKPEPSVINHDPIMPPAPNGTQLTLFQKGGSIKKYMPGGSTVKGFQLPEIGHHLIDAARHINAYTGRKRQSELMEKSIQAADYDTVIPQYDQLSSTSGLGVLMQRGNIEKQALNNAYANVPKTSRYSDYLSLANSRAGKSLESERALNLDINNLFTNNERTRLQQSNAYKSQLAQLIGDERRREAAIQSALWQERAGKEAGDIAQTEAGLEQIYKYYKNHKDLQSAAKNVEDKIGIQDWYNTEYNKIQQEILADMKESKLDSTKYYTDPRYTTFKNRLNDLSKLYQYKLAEVEIGNIMDPLTGSYFSINIPRPKVGQKTIPGNISYIKKGGTINSRKVKTSKEMNHERILKNIELDNKRIIQLNENILKLLMSALK